MFCLLYSCILHALLFDLIIGCEEIVSSQIVGQLIQISAASDGTVYGIAHNDHNTLRLNADGASWQIVNTYAVRSYLTNISVASSDEAYGVDTGDNVYKLSENKQSFEKLGDSNNKLLVDVTVNGDGEVMGINSYGWVYKLHKEPYWIWEQIIGPGDGYGDLIQIDNAPQIAMGVEADNKVYIYQLDYRGSGYWTEITLNSQNLLEISVADDGTAYALDSSHNIYRLNGWPSYPSWVQICDKKAISISVVKKGEVYIVDEQNQVYKISPAPTTTSITCDKHVGANNVFYCLPDITPDCTDSNKGNFCQTGCGNPDNTDYCPDGYRKDSSMDCWVEGEKTTNQMCYKHGVPLEFTGRGDMVNMDNNHENQYYNEYHVDMYIVIIISIFMSLLCTSIILCIVYKYSAFKTRQTFQVIPSMDQDDDGQVINHKNEI